MKQALKSCGLECLVQDHRIIPRVVGGATWNEVGELIVFDHVEFSKRNAVHFQKARDFVDACLDGVVGGRLSETANRLLGRLVGEHSLGIVLHAFDFVGTHNGTYWFSKLQG